MIASGLPVPRQIVLYVGHLSLKHDESLPDMAMRREMVGGGEDGRPIRETLAIYYL